MKIDILTLFPELFEAFLSTSIIKRAIDKGIVTVELHNFRDDSLDPHHKVDDSPYGGGQGMVLMCQPIFDCIEKIRTKDSYVVMLTPDGIPYRQNLAYELSQKKHLILLCGHYEGFDERIRSLVDLELSIGDYILTGGELASQVVADSIIRLLPGAIQEESHLKESFHEGLLDYPTYTKPAEFRGMKVPEVLISGDHAKIEAYRVEQMKKRTKERRPDLWKECEFYDGTMDRTEETYE